MDALKVTKITKNGWSKSPKYNFFKGNVRKNASKTPVDKGRICIKTAIFYPFTAFKGRKP